MSAQENSHIVDQEKSILKEQINTEEELMTSLCFNHFLEILKIIETNDAQDCENSYLYFEMNVYEQIGPHFMKKMNFLREIKMSLFDLMDIKSKNKHCVKSCFSSLPKCVAKCEIRSSYLVTLNISPYMEGITRISSKVLKLISINNFKLSHPQIKRVMVSYKHVEEVKFEFCDLSMPVILNFAELLESTNVKIIGLTGSIEFTYNELEPNLNGFQSLFSNLVESIATSSDLKKTLMKIELTLCDIETLEARRILDRNGLGNIEVFG
ncbi:unnamed protein product [Moneuplotes crassus]|uniref:Uncharacterized protein n=1 Tax=Euplotes crassus TaxID=5936 RepID=A0AAD1XEX7_EUPCR|nr:unnamed protein product [Moneuplotes crassus]